MLTGYNTDIEHGGTVYHVQTEDKGASAAYIESLVYVSGEIVFSRRTAYRELLESGADTRAVADLMEKQHRSIVEALRRSGLSGLTAGEAAPDDETVIGRPDSAGAAEGPAEADRSLDQVILAYLEAQKNQEHLVLRTVSTQDFVYGREIELEVAAVTSREGRPVAGAAVEVVFKSTAEPRRLRLASGATDERGRFRTTVRLPGFNGGTSAVVIAAESDLGRSEIKQLVHR